MRWERGWGAVRALAAWAVGVQVRTEQQEGKLEGPVACV